MALGCVKHTITNPWIYVTMYTVQTQQGKVQHTNEHVTLNKDITKLQSSDNHMLRRYVVMN